MKTPDDFKRPERLPVRGKLWLTRADHLRAGSSPPIDSKFGDDMCMGDTLSDTELTEFMTRELRGIKKMLSSPPDVIQNFKESFLDPKYLESELSYYRKRGLNVTEGESLLEQLRALG
jgi:hypothetical protein